MFAVALIGQIGLSPRENDAIAKAYPAEKLTTADQTLLQTPSLDTSLKIAGSFYDELKLDFADGLDVSGKYAYVTSVGNDSFTIFDISNPENPTEVTTIQDSVYLNSAKGICVSGYYAYISAGESSSGVVGFLAIYDISDPASPYLAGYVDDTKLAGALHVSVAGKYAYVTSPEDNRFVAVDISNPESPSIAGSIQDDTNLYKADGLYVSGHYGYVTSHQLTGTAYFNVIDISDPTALSPSDMVSLGRPEFIGGDQPYITGRYAYVPATSSGPATGSLSVVDISDPSHPSFVSTLSDERISGADWVWVTGHYAFVGAFYAHRLTIVDISDPRSLTIASSLYDETNLNNIAQVIVSGKYAYATTLNAKRFVVIDISGFELPPANTGDLAFSVSKIFHNFFDALIPFLF